MIKLLAIDMDGTCLNKKSLITNKTMEALIKAAQSGIMIVPTTGRALSILPHQLQKEHFYNYVISSNGATVTMIGSNETIVNNTIDYQLANQILLACKKKGVGFTAHINNNYYVQGHLLESLGKLVYGQDADNSYYCSSLIKKISQEKCHVEELQLYFYYEGAMKKVESILQNFPVLTAYGKNYVEIFALEASKGNALKGLAKMLNISQEEIACIGDSENDLTMFKQAGYTFAMGNAIDSLKQQANIILPSNDEDGVAEAINKYLLQQS